MKQMTCGVSIMAQEALPGMDVGGIGVTKFDILNKVLETETDAAQTTIVEGEDATDTTPERAPGEPTGEGDTDADADDRDVRAAGDEFGDS